MNEEIAQVLSGERRWCVTAGNCLDVLPYLENASIDHVITDPPYSRHQHENVLRGVGSAIPDGNGRMTKAAIKRSTDYGFDHLDPLTRRRCATEFARLVRRWVLVFSDVESSWLWRLSLTRAGLNYRRTAEWRRIGGAPQFSGDCPAASFEAITVAHIKGRGRARWNGGGKCGAYEFPIVANRSGHRNDRVHTTQKPLELMMALVEDFTDPGDVILDAFCGSGTTGVAAIRLGRRFIGIELSHMWAELSRERLSAESEGSTLNAARAGQLPLLAGGGK